MEDANAMDMRPVAFETTRANYNVIASTILLDLSASAVYRFTMTDRGQEVLQEMQMSALRVIVIAIRINVASIKSFICYQAEKAVVFASIASIAQLDDIATTVEKASTEISKYPSHIVSLAKNVTVT